MDVPESLYFFASTPISVARWSLPRLGFAIRPRAEHAVSQRTAFFRWDTIDFTVPLSDCVLGSAWHRFVIHQNTMALSAGVLLPACAHCYSGFRLPARWHARCGSGCTASDKMVPMSKCSSEATTWTGSTLLRTGDGGSEAQPHAIHSIASLKRASVLAVDYFQSRFWTQWIHRRARPTTKHKGPESIGHLRAPCGQASLSGGNPLHRRGSTLNYWTRLSLLVGIVFLGWEHQVNVQCHHVVTITLSNEPHKANQGLQKRSRSPQTALSAIRLHGTDFHVSKKVWQECDGRRSGHEDK